MITLEISSTNIRLMETEGDRVVKWASRSLQPGIFEEEVLSDSRALGTSVKQLMTSSGINATNVTISISGLYSLSRVVMVPTPAGGSVNQEAVLGEVREVIPLSEDEMYFSWQPVAAVEGGQQVLVVGVPRDVVDSEVQALRASGLNPRVLDLKTMALARAVNREQALILNIEPTSFDTVLIAGGLVEVMHTAAWQPDDLSAEDKVEHLAVALELTVGFYDSHHAGFPLDPATPLFITGQMSGDLALMEKLEAKMGYPIEPLAPPLECPAHMPVSQYAVNIGLALKGKSLEQGGYLLPDINLLPDAYKPWRPSVKQIYLFVAIVAAIALLFPLYQATSEAMDKTAKLEARYTILNNELERRKAELRAHDPLREAIAQYNSIVDMGGGFIEDLEVINNISEEFGIKVGSITHGGGSITFSCQADSHTAFRNYLAALKECGRFSSVSSPPYLFPDVKSGTLTLVPKTGE